MQRYLIILESYNLSLVLRLGAAISVSGQIPSNTQRRFFEKPRLASNCLSLTAKRTVCGVDSMISSLDARDCRSIGWPRTSPNSIHFYYMANPGNLNPDGGNATMFGLCGVIEDLPKGQEPSRHHWWNAYSCGYQAYRQGKAFGVNPYHNDELETRWSAGWNDARNACQTGKGPFDSK
jgi:hypothetical protein